MFEKMRSSAAPLPILLAAALAGALLGGTAPDACTTLTITDTNGGVYLGRTMEFALDLPWQLTYFPAGREYTSKLTDGTPGLAYRTKYRMMAVTMPLASPTDLKVVDGLNAEGLTFSALAFPAVGPEGDPEGLRKALAAVDLGSWALGQFATVAEVKTALESQPVILTPLSTLGNARTPLHYVLHDRTGAGIVIEYADAKQTVYDNPVNVMTNGPRFPWHLTNLGNYSFLTNV
ncbi:linear amide C-N hydrolase [uncultured Thiodictyon sp.]|jgi:penicillin V acylase-like amidase (Ntn superfamily)|uniref:linear amide C-N hydrolase n=1 Tax=uncultured Thiodictyon sp. TaxID=1846217 RepID=UPI0025D72C91|nr:linear amide C-N hydrolase [uncultured Thiodictyon sp.]